VNRPTMLEERPESQEDQDRYRVLIENQAMGISEVDAEEYFLFANPAAHRIFGVPPGTLVGRNLREFVDEKNFSLVRQETQRRREGQSSTYDLEIIRADGARRILRINASPRFDREGRFLSALAIYSDVTELKEAEESLRRRERYYRALLHNAADMITILDRELRFLWGSRSTAFITGYTEEIYGRCFLDFIHPDEVPQARLDFDYIIRNPGITFHGVRRFRHSDGTYHYHEGYVTNLLENPTVRGIIINSRDITERKMIEEQLRLRNLELDSFATTVAHDLRVPLSIITGYAELLQSDDTDEEERRLYLSNIAKAAQRLDELTSALLTYAQAGKPEGRVAPIDPGEVIREILEERAEDLAGKGVEVRVEEPLPRVSADRFKLHQVFFNLLDNAIKYSSQSRHPLVEIGAEERQGEVVFHVRDNGKGIDPALAEEIFMPFKRYGEGGEKGLGIGLSIVKRAVEAWGGRIWLTSVPGEGSTFFFTALPGASA